MFNCPVCGIAHHGPFCSPPELVWPPAPGIRITDIPGGTAARVAKAAEIAQQAAELVDGERDRLHGAKVENHQNIANLWSAYLDMELGPRDVALMMVLLKVARTMIGDHNLDDYIDMAGYAGCAGEIAEAGR